MFHAAAKVVIDTAKFVVSHCHSFLSPNHTATNTKPR